MASLPRLCPDLSATVYGGRVALAAMARALGKDADADRWLADAATIRAAIIARLHSADDAAFFDVDAQDRFVRVRGDVISRVLGEHVADQAMFEDDLSPPDPQPVGILESRIRCRRSPWTIPRP